MALSRDERELLLGVAVAQEETVFNRLERALGTKMDIESLLQLEDTSGGPRKQGLPPVVSIPLLAAVAPELIDHLSKKMRQRYQAAASEYAEVPQGGMLVDVGNLSVREAKAFFKQIASEMASAKE